jgi:hydroxyacylglutathione hydrolase
MLLERIESEGLSHYSYLIGANEAAAVIDPRRDCLIYAEKAARKNMRIRYIFETHRNEDYLSGSVELASITGAEVWHADGQWDYRYGTPSQDGQEWHVGGLAVKAILSPGHTPGMMSYLLHDEEGAPWVVFTGDALFAGEVGRVDFMGSDRLDEMAALLYGTLFERLLPLGDGVIVCPAHGPGSVCGSHISTRIWTTIGLERCHNPKLQLCEPFRFIAETAVDHEKAPYFTRMEQLNLVGAPLLGQVPVLTPLSPCEFKEKMAEAVVVDTRSPEAFAASHVPGALSIWLGGLAAFAGWFLSYDKPLLLVVDEGKEETAVRALVRIGYDSIAGRLSGGMLGWLKTEKEAVATGVVTVAEMRRLLDSGSPAWLLDVRSDEEREVDGRVDGSHHVHVTQLPRHMDEIPREGAVYVFCATGFRAMIAASCLQRAGWDNVKAVLGGPPFKQAAA